MLDALHQLSTASLRAFASSLRDGPLSAGVSRHAVQQIAGALAAQVAGCLEQLISSGMQPEHVALIAEAIADARAGTVDTATALDLVLSGPDVPGIPTADTAAVMHGLIQEATQEVLLVGYAVHHIQSLFGRLAGRMEVVPGIRVWMCLDVQRRYTDTSLADEIVRRFVIDFRTRHWPWPQLPELYYDPRSLADSTAERSSLHAKCIVVDRRTAFITSANFTEAAQHRNIEAGVLLRYPNMAERLAGYFEALTRAGLLVRCRIH